MADHDHSYKLLFSHPRMVEDLLRGFVREEWVEMLDFTTLERVSGSYVADDLRERQDDIVWRVRFSDKWLYVYILLEFQSSVDKLMALRVMSYLGLLYQDLVRAEQLTQSGKLPPVLPIVLYNGENEWTAVEDVAELIENIPGGLSRYGPRLRYLLIDEGRYEKSELMSLRNLVAALFQLEHSRSVDEVEEVVIRLIEWLGEPEQQNLQRAFAVWIHRVFLRGDRGAEVETPVFEDLNEVKTMLSERIKEWTEKSWEKGKAEGKAEGDVEARVRLAKRMLSKGMSVAQVAELTELTKDEVAKLQDSVAN